MDILTIFKLRCAAVSIPILSHTCADISRQGWDPDTSITDLRKIQSSVFSEKSTNRLFYQGHVLLLGLCT